MRRIPGTAALFLFIAVVFNSNHSGNPAGPNLGKLDRSLRDRLFESSAHNLYRKRHSPAGGESFDLFVRTRNPDVLRRHRIRVRTILGDIAAGSAGRASVESMMADPDVTWIEGAVSYRPVLDVSLISAGVVGSDGIRPRYNGTTYTGRGVVVGIVDTGIDWSHGDFINPLDGSSRILRLWDQTEDSGRPPAGFDFDFGTEYLQSEITREINGSTYGTIRSMDFIGHGTHVAGIACGNGLASGNGYPPGRYAGVAPEADLIVVKVPESYNSGAILSGIRYIFSKADSLNRPAVVNLSMGAPTQEGPHDGSTSFEQSIDALLGGAGRAIVAAAGNFGGQAVHFKGEFTSSNSDNLTFIPFRIESNHPDREDYVAFDVWNWPACGLAVSVVSPGGRVYGPVAPFSSRRIWESTEDGLIDVDNAAFGPNPNNGDMQLRIRISDDYLARPGSETLRTGEWKLAFTGKPDDVNQRPGVFQGWLCDSNTEAEITVGADDSSVIAEPGNSRLCVTVGGYTSRTQWPRYAGGLWGPGGTAVDSIAAFSGSGPPRQNSQNSAPENKPELAAPAEYVLSSFSSFFSASPDSHFIAADGVHIAMHGTSMAVPHVTGVIALLFEADPDLDSYTIKRILINGAGKVEAMRGRPWDRRWGYGILDADAMLRAVTSVREASRTTVPDGFSLSPNFPNPFNASTAIRVSVPPGAGRRSASLHILDLSGKVLRRLHQGPLKAGEHAFVWDGTDDRGEPVPSGVYVCRLTASHAQSIRKMCCIR
jgi:subtilisin family serine protease